MHTHPHTHTHTHIVTIMYKYTHLPTQTLHISNLHIHLPTHRQTCSVPSWSFQARLDLSLETEADCLELDSILAQQQHSFTGFARQMWAYITVNQLLAER